MMRGRELDREYLEFYRKYVPGCDNMEMVTTGSLMGVRESRRIAGEYELNFDDYLARREFPDQIGVFNKAVDIHVYDDQQKMIRHLIGRWEPAPRLRPNGAPTAALHRSPSVHLQGSRTG